MDGARTEPGGPRRVPPRGRRGRLLLISALVLVLAGTGLGTWAAGTWPWPKERYCWGAWEEDSGPGFLGDEAFGDAGGSRTGKETAPTPEHPTGSCGVSIARTDTSDDDGDTDTWTTDQEVSVEYRPVPRSAADRLAMVQDTFLTGDVVPLPDGLPGTVNGQSGLLVLPKSCDTPDGRPTVVTLQASGTYTGGSSSSHNDPPDLGGARQVAALLVAAANHGMAAAGCAPHEPLKVSSPLYDLPSSTERIFDAEDLCGIRGLRLGVKDVEYRIGAVTDDLQTCDVRDEHDGVHYLDLAMVAQPRLAAVFDGITGERPVARGWRGTGTLGGQHSIVRADCDGRPVIFLMGASADPGDLALFSNAAAARLGCAPVAPKGAAR